MATSGGKVVIGDLQSLREFIQNDENTEISFLWERELKDVMMVKFSVSEDVVIVCKDGSVYTVDQNSLNDPKTFISSIKHFHKHNYSNRACLQ